MNQNYCHEFEVVTEAHPPIEQKNPRPEITPYAVALIECKAKQLVGKCGFQLCDRDDIEQELYLDLWERLDKFDSEKATYSTFVQRVVENKISNILREHCSDKGLAERTALSLSKPLHIDQASGKEVTLGDCVTNEQYDDFARNKNHSRVEELDMTLDMQQVLARLPEYARRPCELLMEGRTIDETAQLVGMKRITFYRQIIEPLREVLLKANLEIFL